MTRVSKILSWYIDFLFLATIWGLVRYAFSDRLDFHFAIELSAFLALRWGWSLLGRTLGTWALGEEPEEAEPAPRKSKRIWANWIAGTLLFLEGTKSMVRWTEMDRPIPFMGFIPSGIEQPVVGIAVGFLFVAAGTVLLRRHFLGPRIGLGVLAFSAVSTALSWNLWNEAISAMVIARRQAQGLPVRDGEIEFMQSLFPEGLLVALGLSANLLFFCEPRLLRS